MRVAVLLACCVFPSAFSASVGSGSAHFHQSMGISPNGNIAIAKGDERSSDLTLAASRSSRHVADDRRGAFAQDLADTVHVSRIIREEKKAVPNGPTTEEKEPGGVSHGVNALATIIQLVILFVFAFMYKRKVVDAYPRERLQALQPQTDQKEFQKGMCDCCGNMHLCLHATCCWAARAAHTWEVMGIADYWVGVFAAVCCPLCMPCIGGCFWRAQLREKFGIEKNMFMDFLMWLCCTPCAVGQEAMQVDDVVGMSVQCCCNLTAVSEGDQPLLSDNAGSSGDTAPANNDTAPASNDTANPESNEPNEEEVAP